MTFDLPDRADADFDAQSRLYSSDLKMVAMALELSGVKSGGLIAAQGSPNMTTVFPTGIDYWLAAEVPITAGNVTHPAADATNDRIDLVVANSSGVKSVVAGTPAPIPLEPPIPALSVVHAQVVVPKLTTVIGPTQIRDRRIIIQIPSVTGASNLAVKTADETVTSSTVLQNDNHLFFNTTTNTKYLVRYVLMMTQPVTNNSMKVNFTGPAASVWRMSSQVTDYRASDGNAADFSFGVFQTPAIYALRGVVITAGTGGNFQLNWAQVTSSVNGMKMLLGSYLEYRVLA